MYTQKIEPCLSMLSRLHCWYHNGTLLLRRALKFGFLTDRYLQRLRNTLTLFELIETFLHVSCRASLNSESNNLLSSQDNEPQESFLLGSFNLSLGFILRKLLIQLFSDSGFLSVCEDKVHVFVER